jgi:hypothetical protein
MKLSPMKNTMIAFIASVILVGPQFFVYSPNQYTIFSNRTGFSTVYFVETSAFAKSLGGKIIQNAVTIFRSVVICLIYIILNLISLYLFKQHMTKKSQMVGPRITENSISVLSIQNSSLQRNISQNNAGAKLNAERNATQMVTFMCVVSVVHQIVLLANFLYVLIVGSFNFSTSILLFITSEVTSLRHATNFFVFYFFNRNLSSAFNRLCGKLKFL